MNRLGAGVFGCAIGSAPGRKRSVVTMSNLRNEIRNLSTAEKFELLDALWESLQADELALTETQRDELDFRIAQYERNPDEVMPWEQVRAGLLKNG